MVYISTTVCYVTRFGYWGDKFALRLFNIKPNCWLFQFRFIRLHFQNTFSWGLVYIVLFKTLTLWKMALVLHKKTSNVHSPWSIRIFIWVFKLVFLHNTSFIYGLGRSIRAILYFRLFIIYKAIVKIRTVLNWRGSIVELVAGFQL